MYLFYTVLNSAFFLSRRSFVSSLSTVIGPSLSCVCVNVFIYMDAIRDVATVLYWSCLFNEKHNKELFFALVIDGALNLGFSYL